MDSTTLAAMDAAFGKRRRRNKRWDHPSCGGKATVKARKTGRSWVCFKCGEYGLIEATDRQRPTPATLAPTPQPAVLDVAAIWPAVSRLSAPRHGLLEGYFRRRGWSDDVAELAANHPDIVWVPEAETRDGAMRAFLRSLTVAGGAMPVVTLLRDVEGRPTSYVRRWDGTGQRPTGSDGPLPKALQASSNLVGDPPEGGVLFGHLPAAALAQEIWLCEGGPDWAALSAIAPALGVEVLGAPGHNALPRIADALARRLEDSGQAPIVRGFPHNGDSNDVGLDSMLRALERLQGCATVRLHEPWPGDEGDVADLLELFGSERLRELVRDESGVRLSGRVRRRVYSAPSVEGEGLEEARQTLREVLSARPRPACTLIKGETGLGKSYETARMLARLVGRPLGFDLVWGPTHPLAIVAVDTHQLVHETVERLRDAVADQVRQDDETLDERQIQRTATSLVSLSSGRRVGGTVAGQHWRPRAGAQGWSCGRDDVARAQAAGVEDGYPCASCPLAQACRGWGGHLSHRQQEQEALRRGGVLVTTKAHLPAVLAQCGGAHTQKPQVVIFDEQPLLAVDSLTAEELRLDADVLAEADKGEAAGLLGELADWLDGDQVGHHSGTGVLLSLEADLAGAAEELATTQHQGQPLLLRHATRRLGLALAQEHHHRVHLHLPDVGDDRLARLDVHRPPLVVEAPVVVLDATATVQDVALALEVPSIHQVELPVVLPDDTRGLHTVTGRLSRQALLTGEGLPALTLALRDWVAHSDPDEETLLVTYRQLVEPREGDDPDWAEPRRLLRQLVEDSGRAVRWTWYGASDARGSNLHEDLRQVLLIGDPVPNLDGVRAQLWARWARRPNDEEVSTRARSMTLATAQQALARVRPLRGGRVLGYAGRYRPRALKQLADHRQLAEMDTDGVSATKGRAGDKARAWADDFGLPALSSWVVNMLGHAPSPRGLKAPSVRVVQRLAKDLSASSQTGPRANDDPSIYRVRLQGLSFASDLSAPTKPVTFIGSSLAEVEATINAVLSVHGESCSITLERLDDDSYQAVLEERVIAERRAAPTARPAQLATPEDASLEDMSVTNGSIGALPRESVGVHHLVACALPPPGTLADPSALWKTSPPLASDPPTNSSGEPTRFSLVPPRPLE